MRSLVLTLLCSVFFLPLHAQNFSVYGLFNSNGQNTLTVIDPDSGLVTPLSPLAGSTVYVMASTDFDELGERYFVITDNGIEILDATTGTVLGTLPTVGNMTGLKYLPGTNTLYGLYSSSQNQIDLVEIDVTTAQVQTTPLPGINTYVANSTVLDRSNLRYMFLGLNGLYIVDLNTNNMIGPYAVQGNYCNLVYDAVNNTVIGQYYKASTQSVWLAKVDLATGSFTDIGPMQGGQYVVAGAAAFDDAQRRYITITNRGIEVFDADNATTLKTFPTYGNLSELHFYQTERPLLSTSGHSVCEGKPMTVRALGDFDQYFWSDGYQGQSRIITAGANLQVTGIKNGQSHTSGLRVITDNGPTQPDIRFENGVLITQSSYSKEWLVDGVVIPGATGNTLIPTQSGVYQVRAYSGNACYKDSEPYPMQLTSVAGNSPEPALLLYPNPVRDQLIIEDSRGFGLVVVRDIRGKELLRKKYDRSRQKEELTLGGLSAGVYLIEVGQGMKKETQKIVLEDK